MALVQHPWMHEADALVLGQPDDTPAREVEVAASGVVLGRGMVFPIGTRLWLRGDGAGDAVAAGTFRPAGLAKGSIMDGAEQVATLEAGEEVRPLPAHAKRATMVAEPVTNVAEPIPAGQEPKEPARKAKRAAKKRGA